MARILVTNDDGVQAPGLRILVDELVQEGHDVFVVAPADDCSAMSMRLTLHQPLEVQFVNDWTKPDAKGKFLGAVGVSGSPCDCILVALSGGLERWSEGFVPDLLVAGINLGPNLGTDINHSGTVGAAREGALHGVPALATSLASRDEDALPAAAEATLAVVRRLLQILPEEPINYLRPDLSDVPWCKPLGHTEGHEDLVRAAIAFGCADLWFNLNIPPAATTLDVESCVPGLNIYRNAVRRTKNDAYVIGEAVIEKPAIEGTDVTTVMNGRSSLSVMPLWPSGHPLCVDLCMIEAARKRGEGGWPALLER